MRSSLEAGAEPAVRRFVVYGLVDPRSGEVRYVGRTCGDPQKRLAGHLSAIDSRFSGGSRAKREWLRELVGLDLRPQVRVFESFSDEERAVEAEGEWIRKGLAGGWALTNGHKSGRGVVSEATKEKKRKEKAQTEAAYQRTMDAFVGKTFRIQYKGDGLRRLRGLVGVRGTTSIDEVMDQILTAGWATLQSERLSSSSSSPAQTEVAR